MEKRKKLATLTVICIIIAVLGAFALNFYLNSPLPASYLASNVKPLSPGYLQTDSGVETKIYLVSATPMYGVFPEDIQQGFSPVVTVDHRDDPCFILNLTVRNDYAPGDVIPETASDTPSLNTHGAVHAILKARMFDKNGIEINATDNPAPGSPFPNRNEFGIGNNVTNTFDVLMATPNRDIDHFNVSLSYLGTSAIP